jgi:GT2 family glycosyltransferase
MNYERNKLVSIVVVTTGAKDYLWRCLDSLKAQSYPNREVIVIDNSLNPEFSSRIRGYCASLQLYSCARNLFYSAALNKGLELSQGDFILCLNDDVVLDKEFIRESLPGFFLKEGVGMVSGRILRPDGLTLDSAGLFLSIWRTAGERGYGRLAAGRFEKNEFIFGVNGAAAFYRRKMLEDVKDGRDYFDPDLRIFYEDLDLAWRAQKRGWQAYYLPRALAYHSRGGSVRPEAGLGRAFSRRYLSDELHKELIKNRYLAILKNETRLSLLGHLIPILLHDLCAWAYIFLFRPKVIKLFLADAKCFLGSKRRRSAGRAVR